MKAAVAFAVIAASVAVLAGLSVITAGTATAALVGAACALGGMVIADTINANSSSIGTYLIVGTIGAITGAMGQIFSQSNLSTNLVKSLATKTKYSQTLVNIGTDVVLDTSGTFVGDYLQMASGWNKNMDWKTIWAETGFTFAFSSSWGGASNITSTANN